MEITDAFMTGWPLVFALAATLLAGVVRGITGFGSALVQAPVYAQIFPPAEAVILVAFLGTLASLQMMPAVYRHVQWRQVGMVTVGAMVAIPLGTYLLISMHPDTMRRGISLIVLAVSLVLLSGWRWRGNFSTLGALLAGAISGVINGAAGTGGPPVVLYWLSGVNNATTNRANLTTYYTFINAATVGALLLSGAVLSPSLWNILLLIPTFSLSLWLGNKLFYLGSDRLYRSLALAMLILVALVTLLVPAP